MDFGKLVGQKIGKRTIHEIVEVKENQVVIIHKANGRIQCTGVAAQRDIRLACTSGLIDPELKPARKTWALAYAKEEGHEFAGLELVGISEDEDKKLYLWNEEDGDEPSFPLA